MLLTIDRTGRVVIPKPIRQKLRLQRGDTLEMETTGDRITLRPIRRAGRVSKEHSVWVFRSGQPLSAGATNQVVQRIREKRDLTNLGFGRVL
jgi:AbrB family looped-hinge helix DNA binding protein